MKDGYWQLAPVNQGFKPISAERAAESSRVSYDPAQERSSRSPPVGYSGMLR